MGFRYRKSKNIGKHFRINFSKSGIGYSWGFKGFRKTHTANGKIRTTYSIPKTGISYVKETNSGTTTTHKRINSKEINYDIKNRSIIINGKHELSLTALKVYSILFTLLGVLYILLIAIPIVIAVSVLGGLFASLLGLLLFYIAKNYYYYRKNLLNMIFTEKHI